MEQGIISAEQGIKSRDQGIFRPEQGNNSQQEARTDIVALSFDVDGGCGELLISHESQQFATRERECRAFQ
jgi:hypothetical protein